MGEYTSSFGIRRYVGRGEGRDPKYTASAKPSLGVLNFIEVNVDANGPVPNFGTGYDESQAKIPAGSAIGRSLFFVDTKGSASSVKLSLVKKDGTDAKDMMAATTPSGDGVVINANLLNGTIVSEDRFVKVSGTTTGLKGRLYIEYV